MTAPSSWSGLRAILREAAGDEGRFLAMGWCTLGSAFAGEIVAHGGADIVCLDLEHGLMGWDGCIEAIMVLSRSPVPTVVRVSENRGAEIAKALDGGASGVVVPHVDTPGEAASAVSATRYPAEGHRSWGPTRASLLDPADPVTVNERVACIVMLETAAAIGNCADIARVPGVDALLVGSNDLCLALAGQGRSAAEVRHDPSFTEMLSAVAAAGRSAGIAVAAPAGSTREAETLCALGFDVIVLPSDVALLRRAVQLEVQTFDRLRRADGRIAGAQPTPTASY